MKYAVVTGGTRGIGKAVVEMFLAEGYYVIATYGHNLSYVNQCVEQWKSISTNFELIKCDQSSKEDVSNFTKKLNQNYKQINSLVLNAGITLRKDLTDTTNDDWEQMMQVNVNSNVYIIRDLFNQISVPLQSSEHNSIIIIGSMMAVYPHGTSLAYGVTKSALHALAKNLVKCFEGKNVTINAIAPGFVETEWQKEKPAEIRNNIYNKTALRRFATVEEIADAVKFCVKNSYINGTIIEVSGGYCYK